MNKIKLMYDVVKTMKEKEVINGSLTVEGKKDQVQFLRFENEFQRNLLTGGITAKISSQLDVEGKKVKHESSTEFALENNRSGMCHHFGKEHHHPSGKSHSFKDKLTAVAFVLNLIDNMQVREQEDKILVTISLNEIPEEFKKAIHGKMNNGQLPDQHRHPFPMQAFMAMKETNIGLTVQISKTKEVEEITIIVDGAQNGELNDTHVMHLQGELRFSW